MVGYIGVTVIRQQALACYQRIEFADLTYNFSSCFSFSSLWSPCLIFSSSHPCLCSCEGSRRRSQSRIRQTISTTNQRGERWRAHRRLWPAAGSAQPWPRRLFPGPLLAGQPRTRRARRCPGRTRTQVSNQRCRCRFPWRSLTDFRRTTSLPCCRRCESLRCRGTEAAGRYHRRYRCSSLRRSLGPSRGREVVRRGCCCCAGRLFSSWGFAVGCRSRPCKRCR